MSTSGIRGLSVFIGDIRNCQNKDSERIRVDRELANIRTKFKSDRALTPYDKKKYVWKMLYIYMLGYEVDFGHLEAVNLISAPKYSEKQVGYMVTSVLLNENHDFLRLVINSVRNDIVGRNETAQCLALTMVGNIGGKEFAESLAGNVQQLLVADKIRPLVRKKAALCLLRLYRKNPDVVNLDGWGEKMASLLEEKDIGVLTAVVTLLVALVAQNPENYLPCVPKLVQIMERLIRSSDIPQEYTYYNIPSPWLQVKIMRALQYFPSLDDPSVRQPLFDVLRRILLETEVVKNVNKNNASHSILFEAIALAMHLDSEPSLMAHCVNLLGKFIAVREPNIRYLGLENMARVLRVSDVHSSVAQHQGHILSSLRDPDISIRRRTLELLYSMCDSSNAKQIVEELLKYLAQADFAIREDLVLKIAILAERFAPDLSWYIDVVLELIQQAGEFVSDDMWHRVVQIVTNNEDLQAYAASKARVHLASAPPHETMVKTAGYILGEYSHLLINQPGCSPLEIFTLLHQNFATSSVPTKAMLLTSYVKILLRTQPPDASLSQLVHAVLRKHENFMDAEVQQRAVEYTALLQRGEAMVDIVAEMPHFPERQSALVRRAEEAHSDTADMSAEKSKALQASSQAIVPVSEPSDSIPSFAVPSAQTDTSESRMGPDSQSAAVGADDSESVAVTETAESTASAPLPDSTPEQDSSSQAQALAVVPAQKAAPEDMLAQLLSLDLSPPAVPVAEPPALPDSAPVAEQQPPSPLLFVDEPQGSSSSVPPAPAPAPAPVPAASLAEPLPAAPAPVPAAAAEPASPELLAVAVYGAPAATVVQPVGSVEEWFQGLVLKDSGVLYEDPFLQIGVKSEWQPPHGRIVLYLGNKDTAPLSALSFLLPPATGFRLQPIGPAPDLIPPRAQIQFPLTVTATHWPLPLLPASPAAVPWLHLLYSTAAVAGQESSQVDVKLRLPCSLNKFLSPIAMEAADFFQRWKALAAAPLKIQEVVRGVKPLSLPAMSALLDSLHIAVSPNLDPNPNNLVAATIAYCEAAAPTLVLVRIETDPADRTQLRLTVGSPDPAATSAVRDFFKLQLADPSALPPVVPAGSS